MLRKTITGFIIIFSSLCLQSQNFSDLNFGTDSTFDVMTWNIEWFPKNGQITMTNVSQIIDALDMDLIAVQEIDDKSKFGQMVASLDGWNSYFLYGEYQSLAYIYKKSTVQLLDAFEIFTEDWREFPRSPLVVEVVYEGNTFFVINNHLKCCGDGEMQLQNAWDEETRRYDACNMLDDFIRSDLSDERVILLGDLNDILTDGPGNNVFKAFFEQADDYLFADIQIAQGSSSGWSYPNWPSHLDHLLITNELFYSYWDDASKVQTIKLDDYFPGGMDEYDEKVSDHRPVAISFAIPENFGTNDNVRLENLVRIFPNPAGSFINIRANEKVSIQKLELYSSTGSMILEKYNPSERIDVTAIPSGLYLMLIYFNDAVVSQKVMIK